MAGVPKEAINTPLPPDGRKPMKKNGIKIYQFLIDRLNEVELDTGSIQWKSS